METNIRTWLAEMRERFHETPTRAPLYVVFTWYLAIWFGITSRFPIGTNVYERDWDVLIVLDACRVDTLREVSDEYEFIESVYEVWSIGSHSAEWIAQTFSEEYRAEIEQTQYITGNAHATRVLEERRMPPMAMHNTTPIEFSKWDTVDIDAFASIDTVWENYNNETYRVVLPSTMTDYAIDAGRARDDDRMIVHYMQPHLPYIGQSLPEGRPPTEFEQEGYEKLESGEASREAVYELYKDTLRLALDEVEVLLENLDADRVAITADHGEAFGEMYAYGHPEGFPHPIVKKVPWVETTAEDLQTQKPDLEMDQEVSVDIEEHLRDLGYR
ncbi:hypothetical protein ACFQAS_02810 [Halopenitus salinus]|uniref:Sulfatase N-terminal domain-containing protein n=1 Tax=Halopenitus salinus TaxID=1198295 RepID=A0ABD5UTL6_9EURY